MFSGEDVICKLILEYVNGASHRELIADFNQHTYVEVFWELLSGRTEPTTQLHTNFKKILFVNTDSVILEDVNPRGLWTGRNEVYKVFFADWDALFVSYVTQEQANSIYGMEV